MLDAGPGAATAGFVSRRRLTSHWMTAARLRKGASHPWPSRWRRPARKVRSHDLVVCAHVEPLLQPGSAFLSEVGRVARRGVLLVSDTSGGDDKFFFSELYPRLLGRPYERCCQDGEMVVSLRTLGIKPTVTTIEYRSDQPFENLDEACDFWMTYLSLESAETRVWLRTFLAGRLQREGQGWLAPFRKRAAVIQWDVGRRRDTDPAVAASGPASSTSQDSRRWM